ncbi:preprotein translocase subunit SecE [Candidatus Saccharibacteria bacterium]|nr:preprotein translocase subunit SecE [Candidatus Saccharibacteria bacterium]
MNRITNYIQASIEELKKVVWPTRKQALWLAAIVVVAALVVGVYLSGLDVAFKAILQKLLIGKSA